MEDHRNPVRIVIGTVLNGGCEILPPNQSTIAILLEIKESGCSLNFRKRCRVLFLKELKPLPAGGAELQIPYKFLMVQLTDAKKIEDFLIHVIQNLYSGWFFMEENLSATTERLDVCCVPRN
jgi:hypothetical protein